MIIYGIVASLIAILIVECYHLLRRETQQRVLKRVLSIRGRSCLLVSSLFQLESGSQLIHRKDAYALGHLLELCNRLGIEAQFVPYNRISEREKATDLIVVGGPLNNEITNRYLALYVPSFSLIHKQEASAFKNLPTPSWHYVTGFRVGSHTLLANENEEYGILVKLTEDELDQTRTVHIVFGYSAQGTAGTAYYLWKHHKILHEAFGRGKYCVAVRVSKFESYKSVSSKHIDLTSEAFPS